MIPAPTNDAIRTPTAAAAAGPRPPRLRAPSLLLTRRFLKDPFSLLAEAAREHGDIFSMRLLGLGEWTFVGSPRLVREMFRAPADVLVAGETNRAQLGFMLGHDATFTLDGDAHRSRQRQVHPHLNGRRTHAHVPAIREIALTALAAWPVGRPFAFLPYAHRMSLDVMIRALFGDSGAPRRRALAEVFETFADRGLRSALIAMPHLQVDLGPWSPWGRILRMRARVREAFAAEIARRVEEGDDDGDVTSQLAVALGRNGCPHGAAAVLDEVINLLFAGHETTGNVIAWTLETLHTHPEVLARLRGELDSVLEGEPVEAAHLPRLKYLHAVVHETIRYRPLAPMAGVRLVKRDYPLGSHAVPAGTLVAQCFPLMARRPELFENPDRFDPAHFHERKFRPFEWNPFGGGTRMCVGRGLAETEIKVIVATLLQNARFHLPREHVTPVRHGLFFSPSQGLPLVLDQRLGRPS